MDRRIVLSLYRHKLKNCVKLGYKYGNWDYRLVCNHNEISNRQLRKMYKKGTIGNYLFNNIRHQYKLSRNVNDYQKNILMDYGFHILKTINVAIATKFY